MTEKLQKVLARYGLGSRRAMEQWIKEGRVKVNGKLATLGDRVSKDDKLFVNGRKLSPQKLQSNNQPRVLMYYKKEGEICTRNDPEKRPTVFESIPHLKSGRWVAVGRLDINSSGLILFTDNGDLAQKLMHPSSEIQREYAVRVYGKISDEVLQNLKNGVMLEDGMANFENILEAGGQGTNQWYHVSLSEGRNREVRRLWESQDCTVSRLIRIRFGPIKLTGLRAGKYRDLSDKEKKLLISASDGPEKKPFKWR